MLKHIIALAVAAAAIPAAAVTVTDIATTGGNLVNVVTAESGLLEADIALYDFAPITLGLAAGDGETGFELNSAVDIFTGVELGRNLGVLTLSLTGATFGTVGTITPAFSFAEWSLNGAADTLTIAFKPRGEGFGVLLGGFDGVGSNFVVQFASGTEADVAASLTIGAAAVPEPAAWALMIAGFGLVGAAVRRQRTMAQA
jgi:hypothetical protein